MIIMRKIYLLHVELADFFYHSACKWIVQSIIHDRHILMQVLFVDLIIAIRFNRVNQLSANIYDKYIAARIFLREG